MHVNSPDLLHDAGHSYDRIDAMQNGSGFASGVMLAPGRTTRNPAIELRVYVPSGTADLYRLRHKSAFIDGLSIFSAFFDTVCPDCLYALFNRTEILLGRFKKRGDDQIGQPSSVKYSGAA